MSEVYQIVELDQPAWEIIGGGISDFNTQQAGDDQGKNLCFALKAADFKLCPGV